MPAWRQRLADETDPLWFRAVIEEYVLDCIVGGPQVMRAQPEHLLAPMRRDSVELQSCRSPWPFTTDSTVTSCCWISTKPSISFIEYLTGAVYIQDQDQVGAVTFCRSESDPADTIVARIETLTTSSED